MKSVASKSRRAAEMYLASRTDGLYISMRDCAQRYGVSVGTVYSAVRDLRRERSDQEAA